jgi:hypothetical protein
MALILLRTLKKDYARFGIVADMEEGGRTKSTTSKTLNRWSVIDDAGWKRAS